MSQKNAIVQAMYQYIYIYEKS